MADAIYHVASMEDTVLYKENTKDDTCKQCLELEDQLKDALKELNSAHLIIELLQQESAMQVTSKPDNTNRNNIFQEIAAQVINSEWERVKRRCCDASNKDSLSNKVLTGVNVQMIPVSNCYSALELLHGRDGIVTNITMDHKTEEQEGATTKTFMDPTKQPGIQHV
jgi:hypothetical protein